MIDTVFALVGPTGSGKTDLSIRLAKHFPIEIVSIDSLQVFKGLDIGSAKPTREQLQTTPHHMIDVLNPNEPISAAWYAKESLNCIKEIKSRNHIPLLVGGAGFYFKAITNPPRSDIPVNTNHRSNEDAWSLISNKDPKLAQTIHPNDIYRISRAADLIEQGFVPSVVWSQTQSATPQVAIKMFMPHYDRQVLYNRINKRVLHMLETGLIHETETILASYPESRLRLMKAIGYRESLLFLSGKISKERMVELVQQKSRNYAKRQTTWFKNQSETTVLQPDVIETHLSNYLRKIYFTS
ncbi:MAG: tRNA (adenosine(37)-N6)-dimethylallyltransferase MiaA [Bdellovibrionales bacterium]|nr:tRNA (adenosine(37)-N6)-dimethylallyltransferase MiaA [Bdellovibrionales bacterium]